MTGTHHWLGEHGDEEPLPQRDPLTPEVAHALEDLEVPVPQPIEIDFEEAAARTEGAAMVRRWLKGEEDDVIPDELANQVRALGAHVINSDEDLRLYVEERGYALVPLTELGKVVITEDGPRLRREGEEIVRQACTDAMLAAPEEALNPKDIVGTTKPDLSVIPPTAMLHLALAMMNGAKKYGPFNWRDQPIQLRTYVAAAMRHLLAYLDGEELSADTVAVDLPVHHLAHVMACCAILLDAKEVGVLSDNRPKPGRAGPMVEEYQRNRRFGD